MKQRIKNFLDRNKWLKWVPNALTICNSLCGFAAIVNLLMIGNDPMATFARSAWFILFAMIFDCLDGFAARILNAASMHGLQMDSLSDMVTFGVAPAAMITAISAHCLNGLQTRFCWLQYVILLFAAVYLGCAALRLATYNVHAILEKKSSDKFSGLPSPGAAAAICTAVIFFNKYQITGENFLVILPVYAVIVGILMVSKIQYQHCGKWLTTVKRSKRRIVLVSVIVIAAALRFHETAFVLVNLYVIWGMLAALLRLIGVMKKIEVSAEL